MIKARHRFFLFLTGQAPASAQIAFVEVYKTQPPRNPLEDVGYKKGKAPESKQRGILGEEHGSVVRPSKSAYALSRPQHRCHTLSPNIYPSPSLTQRRIYKFPTR
jgi:hypothetical protein